MNTPIFNPSLLGKLFNRAVDPASAANEAQVALQKIHAHCTAANVMPGDAIGMPDEVRLVPRKEMLSRIADLELALDDAREQARQDQEASRSLRATQDREREAAKQSETQLHAEIAALRAHNDDLIRQIDAARAAVMAQPVIESDADPIVEGKCTAPVEKVVGRRAAARRTTADSVLSSARLEAEYNAEQASPAEGPPWSESEKVRFNVLASMGRIRTSIARTLTREFGRIISPLCVLAMMRERWSGQGYSLAT